MSRTPVAIIAVLALLLGASCGKGNRLDNASSPGEPQYVLKFGHLASENTTWHKAALRFKEIVERESGARIAVHVYPNSQIGTEMELINSIQLGTVDMTITGESLQNWAPKAALLAVPYAFDGEEEMRAVAAGPVGAEIIEQITERTGLVPVAWFERGARHLTSNRPVQSPGDLKGLKVRVPNVPLFVKVWQELGAKPIPMAFSEVFTALQQNTIEAQENPLSLIESASFYEVQDYVNLTAHVRSWIYVVISGSKLEEMPDDLEHVIRDAAREMQSYEHALFLLDEERLTKALAGKGMVFVPVDTDAFSARARAAVVNALNPEQKALFEKIR